MHLKGIHVLARARREKNKNNHRLHKQVTQNKVCHPCIPTCYPIRDSHGGGDKNQLRLSRCNTVSVSISPYSHYNDNVARSRGIEGKGRGGEVSRGSGHRLCLLLLLLLLPLTQELAS
jgi:hypothetical protein